jgi:hypothetical protein
MPKKKEPSDHNSERVREIGSARIETITEELSPMQLEEVRRKIPDLLQIQDDIKDRLRAAAKAAKSELGEVATVLGRMRNEVATGKRRSEIEVREYLTKRNEVIRVRTDTGEQIGARNARAAELQEELPLAPEGDEEGDFA